MRGEILQGIERKGQKYIDRPVYRTISNVNERVVTPVMRDVLAMFNKSAPRDIHILDYWSRTYLDWLHKG